VTDTLDLNSRPAPRALRKLVFVGLALALVAVFLALGSWQVQRRAWKLDLIARVESRIHAEPTAIPAPTEWKAVDASRDEYRHVQLSGRWLDEHSAWVVAATELGTGYWLLTPLQTADGAAVWVNRGYVSQESRARGVAQAPVATVTVTGLLRLNEPRGTWLRANVPAEDRWYSRDVQALSQRHDLSRAAPFFIDADANAAPPRADEPVGGLTVVSFPNNHLVYALTWFTLALLTGWAAWSVWRAGDAPRHDDASH